MSREQLDSIQQAWLESLEQIIGAKCDDARYGYEGEPFHISWMARGYSYPWFQIDFDDDLMTFTWMLFVDIDIDKIDASLDPLESEYFNSCNGSDRYPFGSFPREMVMAMKIYKKHAAKARENKGDATVET